MKRVSKDRLSWLNTLYEIARDVNSTLSLKKRLNIIVEKATTLLKVERASLMLLDKSSRFLTIQAATGLSPAIIRKSRIKIGEGISGWVAQKGRPLLIQDLRKEKRFPIQEKGGYSTHSLLSVPLKVRGKTIGVLNVNNKRKKAVFTRADLDLLSALADEAGIAVSNARLFEELVEANERLRELDKLKSGFVANVSHELRTPLGIVRNFIFAFQREMAGEVSSRQKEYLTLVEENLGRLERLIDNLLDLSKIEAGRFELKKIQTDLSALARRVFDAFQRKSDEKGILLRLSQFKKLPFVYVDPDRMTEVMTNLVDNAVKYTPKGGTVTLSLKEENKQLLLSVTDTGIGIRAKDQKELFQKFRRFGAGLHREKGVGLGLAISKEIVTLHQGTLSVRSEEGKGSTFTVMLPVLSDEAFFLEKLASEIRRAAGEGEVVSLVVLELFNFEAMRDQIGEEGTGSLLDEVVAVVKETVRRPTDIVTSYRQGRVIAILAGADRKGAKVLALRVKETLLTHLFSVQGRTFPLEVRFAIASFPEDGQGQSELMQKIEKTLSSA